MNLKSTILPDRSYTYEPWPAREAGIDGLREIVTRRAARVFYWQGHGGEDRGRLSDGTQVGGIFIDMQTANALVTVRDALNAKNQAGFDAKIAHSPAAFMQMVEFSWSNVK